MTTAKNINNPLLSHSDNQTEAAHSVSNVLAFMSEVLRSGVELNDSKDVLDGAGLILETCANTLNFHFRAPKNRGAA
ncbi:MAG TPA: hypothetical protein PKD38_16185 [Nitrospira sp.]|nr:hypothetical protein [Nitrospira sp.]